MEKDLNMAKQFIMYTNDAVDVKFSDGIEIFLAPCVTDSELVIINNKLSETNEEVVRHLREKGELAREVVRLNHALTDVNEKFIREEIKAQQYKNENDALHEKLETAEFQTNELLQTNHILRDEFEAIKNNVGQLQIDYNQMRPTCMELEQQLETAKRINEQMEDELIFYKNQQAAMHDYENEQFYKK
ncbi:unnamed protein product [Rotaria sp. Silwood2]|nr:unnamed protein product [Rotaria sp. Silwood2]